MNFFKALLPILLITSFSGIQAQNYDVSRSLNASLDFLQIKEEANYGLVFKGPQIRFGFKKGWEFDKNELIYEGDVGIGGLFSRGMAGMNVRVKPLDLTFNALHYIRKVRFSLGPWAKMEYNFQTYPELQSGYGFWHTNYSLGFCLTSKYDHPDVHLRLKWKNSLFGMISRHEAERDPYFFDARFVRIHPNMKGGSFGLYNNSNVELHLAFVKHPRIGYAYTFDYFGYYQEPTTTVLTHSFTVFFYPKDI